ncbi:leucine--tRNA ligase [Variovorax sp. PCZ-1]|uniref:leucine--tRNA ligase n=1 Tax=Variovorax sp. PCZ-1 TaxID=2835533 RepID=UPI001BCFC406|nr:leucine--tRNA ligase [Variovorax sp. PCZ-1]MBS7808782.1 leucine--tRNA ligase [Variovorax sp. PCZ-1]
MQDKYDHTAVEKAAQASWQEKDAYRVQEHAKNAQGGLKPKYYACSMLPYPSGKLHMGHVRNYTINDMLARQLRMKGYNVLMPMGWDAFGLPAENAAMKNGVPPAKWTYSNIEHMKGQMQAMGLAIDWSREMAACDPAYYKWNQWLFLKMLEKGIAYRKTQIVNWDPVDQTVLANEQVIDGKGWRTGATVEKREIPGYYLKITDYAQELLDHVQIGNDKATLTGWPDKVRLMQENWLGKSEGVRFAFPHAIKDASGKLIQDGKMYVFTTRADTIMGVTFVAVAPEHPIAVRAGELSAQLATKIEALKAGGTTEAELALKEKEGVPTGLFVMHPITNEKVEVWVGNYVLISYGDGAVMGVPAHDERDFAFAMKYSLPIKQVVQVADKSFSTDAWQEHYAEKGEGIAVNSGKYDGLKFKACVDAVAADLAAQNLGEKKTTWRLRDWGISRQRYWGTPIPIVHCPEHGAQPVPLSQLPVKLPEDCIPDGSGNPLHRHEGFHKGAVCPICGADARRETDTMDTFVDSSWYFIRYCLPQQDQKDSVVMTNDAVDYWMPGSSGPSGSAGGANGPGMDQYIGGIEHAILHLLYARFWTKVMRDMDLVRMDEPFTKLLCQGMVLNHIYSRKNAKGGKEYFWPHDVEHVHDEAGKIVGAKLKHAVDYAGEPLPAGTPITYEGVGTMSKSKNNGIDPQELIDKYGADTARLYTMFTAPPEATLEWNDGAVEGSYRFLKRVWGLASKLHTLISIAPSAGFIRAEGSLSAKSLSKPAKSLRLEIHSVLKQVSYDYERMQYNTVVSGAMKLLNALEGFKASDGTQAAGNSDMMAVFEGFGILLRVLYPATPHLAHALWQELGYAKAHGDLLDAAWPQVDAQALVQDEIELMLQVGGKLRGSILVAATASKEQIEAAAIASEAYLKASAGAAPKKIIVVPGRLVNIVV